MLVEADDPTHLRFLVAGTNMASSAILVRPTNARALYILAHGAGAGFQHPFMADISSCLGEKGIATLRYQFPYMESGRRWPDPPHLLIRAVRSAVRLAAAECPNLPRFAGGKSLGGRMTSNAASDERLDGVRGIVFLGFPLHAAGRTGTARAAHLLHVDVSMLFLQGTRDRLADIDSMREVCGDLGERATLHVVEGGDHSFKVLKRSGRSAVAVMEEVATVISDWIDSQL